MNLKGTKIFLLLFICGRLSAQDVTTTVHREYEPFVIPKSPTAQSIEQYGNLGANTSKGTLDVKIPIFSFEVDGVKIPIELVYNSSGVRVNDLSTSVGQNWSLVADGRVNRNIVGLEDENMYGYLNMPNQYKPSVLGWNNLQDCNQKLDLFELFGENGVDCSPDNFNYSFNGYSGDFVFFKDVNNNISIYKQTIDRIKLNNTLNSELHSSFTAEDGLGNTYEFGGDISHVEVNANTSRSNSQQPGAPIATVYGQGITGWLLKKITTKNNLNIEYKYKKVSITNCSLLTSMQQVFSPLSEGQNGPIDDIIRNSSEFDYESCLVDSIISPKYLVLFTYTDDDNLALWKTKLTNIKVVDRVKGSTIKEYNLSYLVRNGRLFLSSVGQNPSNLAKPYILDYNNLYDVCAYGAMAQDLFGYQNGQYSNNSLVPITKVEFQYVDNTNGNRYVCPNSIIIGSLKSITYPTGGRTEISYEPNYEVTNNKVYYAAGIRVKRTEDYENNTLVRSKNYLYYALAGSPTSVQSADIANYITNYTTNILLSNNTPLTTISSGNSIDGQSPNAPKGFYYGKVLTIEGMPSAVIHSYTLPCASAYSNASGGYLFSTSSDSYAGFTEENYVGVTKGNSIVPMLKARRIYNSLGKELERTENTYETYADNSIFDELTRPVTFILNTQKYSNWMCEDLGWGWDPIDSYPRNLPQKYLSTSFFSNGDVALKTSRNTSFTSKTDTISRVTSDASYSYNQYLDPVEIIANKGDRFLKAIYYASQGSNKFTSSYMVGLSDSVKLFKILDANDISKKLIDGETYDYDAKGNLIGISSLLLDSYNAATNTNYVSVLKTAEYDYDNLGNVTEIRKYKNPVNSFYWGYNSQYPVAKFINMKYDKISTLTGLKTKLDRLGNFTTISNDAEKNQLKLLNDSIKSIIPEGSHYSSYTYNPGVGITSETDPNGITSFYYYDALNRLNEIRDDKNNILKKYDYHYSGQDLASGVFRYTIIASSQPSNAGTVNISSSVVECGSSSNITLVPNTGYHVKELYVNGVLKGAISTYTISDIKADQSILAIFEINTYTVSFNSQGGTTISSLNVPHNNTISSPSSPTKVCYTFGGWYKESACTNAWNFSIDVVTANTTLYAKWTIIPYTVTFDSQGGSAVSNVNTSCGSILSAPAAPTRSCYTFGGWYKESACTNAWNFSTNVVTANTTLYAKWTLNSYTVTFNSQGGSAVSSMSANCGSTISAPTAPTRSCYTFGGWYKESACTNAWNFSTDVVTANTTLYAKWTLNSYTVTFNSQGGSAVSGMNANCGSTISTPTAPTRTGYTFSGWFKESACTNAWNFATDLVTSNTTLYAKWTANTYNITYNLNGGTNDPNNTVSYTYGIGLTLSNPTRTGFTFEGWYAETSFINRITAIGTTDIGDKTLYAKWTPNSYNITYNLNGGTNSPSNASSYIYGVGLTLSAPSKMGYTFQGWYTEASFMNQITGIGTTTIGDKVLYAKWTVNSYSVTYSANGSTSGSVPTDVAHNYNTSVTVLGNIGNLARAGYTFAGWNTAANGSGTTYQADDTFIMGASDVTLYAMWMINSYTVTYSANGSTSGSVPTDVAHNYNTSVTVLGNTGSLAKTGYTFAGWNTAANGSGTTYQPGNTFTMGTANVTLYAKWTINSYTVTYNANGSTSGSVPTDVAHNYNTSVTVLGNTGSLAKTGYTFAGWNTAANGSGTTYQPGSTFTMGATNVTLYAKWTINSYTVTYSANGSTSGSAPTDVAHNYNTSVTVLGNTGSLAKTGYTFAGWNTAANGSGTTYQLGNTFTMGAANVTLYAKWNINSYSVTYNANGSTSGSVPTDVDHNYNTSVTVLGNTGSLTKTGYTFAGWNTAANGSGTTYQPGNTFTIGAANVTLYAKWNINTYTITATKTGSGTMSPSGNSTVNYGGSVTYTFTPAAGQQIKVVYVNGVSMGAVSSYTFSNVSSNMSISVEFEATNLTVSTNFFTFSQMGGTQTFSITSNVGWTVTSDSSWLTVNPVGGSNNATITVTCAKVSGFGIFREAIITVTGGGITRTINVSQE